MQEGWKTDSTAVRGRFGTGTAFGTFGELLQGVHADNDLDFWLPSQSTEAQGRSFAPTHQAN